MKEVAQVRLGKGSQMYSVWLPRRHFITLPMGVIPRPVVLRSERAGSVVRQYPLERGWWVSEMGLSVRGRCMALALDEEPNDKPEGFDWDRPRFRIALLDTSTMRLSVVTDVPGAEYLTRIVPSDDGQYVGIAGVRNKAMVLRVRDKQLLWNMRPPRDFGIEYIALSTKNRAAYMGGRSGILYTADLETGEIKASWHAREPGDRSSRITAIAVSPDEKYVAAGTHPKGRAYVWSTETGKLVRIFGGSPGSVFVLLFSPESKRIGAFCPGWVMTGDLSGPLDRPVPAPKE
jgi:hypothetical protein